MLWIFATFSPASPLLASTLSWCYEPSLEKAGGILWLYLRFWIGKPKHLPDSKKGPFLLS